jgi:hypothetical protein
MQELPGRFDGGDRGSGRADKSVDRPLSRRTHEPVRIEPLPDLSPS